MSGSEPSTPRVMEEPLGFQPRCLDCGYDLEGLEDGRCPECGGRFTRAMLVRMYFARQEARDSRIAGLQGLSGWVVAYLAPLVGFFVTRPLHVGLPRLIAHDWTLRFGAVVAVGVHAVGAMLWFWTNRDRWIAKAFYVLAFIPPLIFTALFVLETPYGVVGCVCLALYAAVYAHLALKWSPLVSAVLLLLCIAAPVLAWGLKMLADGQHQIAAGHHWSNSDYPTARGWYAMTAKQCREASYGVIAFGLLLAGMISLSARRAWVRLRVFRLTHAGTVG